MYLVLAALGHQNIEPRVCSNHCHSSPGITRDDDTTFCMVVALAANPVLEQQVNVLTRLSEDRMDLWKPLVHVLPVHPRSGGGLFRVIGDACPDPLEMWD